MARHMTLQVVPIYRLFIIKNREIEKQDTESENKDCPSPNKAKTIDSDFFLFLTGVRVSEWSRSAEGNCRSEGSERLLGSGVPGCRSDGVGDPLVHRVHNKRVC